jgi:hypothetical protein
MIDLLNFIVGVVCAFVLGLATHSIYLHSKKRKELSSLPWDHIEVGDIKDDEQ